MTHYFIEFKKFKGGILLNNRIKGIILAGSGGCMWGVSGIFAQILFDRYSVSSEWLVSTRLLAAGILILAYSSIIVKNDIFVIFKTKKDFIQLFLFGIVGMIGCQYLFFKTIETSGAAAATILQFTSPIVVYFYLLINKEKKFNFGELLFVLAAFFGVLLIVTNGQMHYTSVSPSGLAFGMGTAFGAAFYTLQPRKILAKYDSPTVVGWGMLIGGGLFQFTAPFWEPHFSLTIHNFFLLSGIIFFGTAMAFLFYLSSLQFIEASLASVLTALEPILATILSFFVFKRSFGWFEILGSIIVLVSVLLLSHYSGKNNFLKQ